MTIADDWNRKSHPMKKEEQSGVWSIVLAPSSDGSAVIKHGSRVKISLGVSSGENEGQCFMFVDRVPAWIKYAKPYRSEDHKNVLFEGIFWNPQKEYVWQNQPVPFNAIFFESEDHLRGKLK